MHPMAAAGTRHTDGWRRAIAVAVGLLFLAASGIAPAGHRTCPHHGHRPAPAQQGGPADAPRSGGVQHAPAQPSPSGPCTCVGACHAGAATPAVAAGGDTGFDGVPTGPLVVDVPRDAVRVPDAYLLPYPNGPPPAA